MRVPVLEAERALRKLRRHTEEASGNQPEGGARTTHGDGYRDTGDVADADSSGNGGTQGLKMGDFARVILLRIATADQTDGMAEATDVDEAQVEGEEQATATPAMLPMPTVPETAVLKA